MNLKRNIDELNPKLIVLILYTTNDLDETRKDNRFGISKPIFIYRNGNLLNLNPNISRFSCLNLRTRLRFAKFLIGTCQSNVIKRNEASLTIGVLINEIRKLGIQRNIPTLIVLSPALTAVEAVACEQTSPPDTCLEYDLGFDILYHDPYRFPVSQLPECF